LRHSHEPHSRCRCRHPRRVSSRQCQLVHYPAASIIRSVSYPAERERAHGGPGGNTSRRRAPFAPILFHTTIGGTAPVHARRRAPRSAGSRNGSRGSSIRHTAARGAFPSTSNVGGSPRMGSSVRSAGGRGGGPSMGESRLHGITLMGDCSNNRRENLRLLCPGANGGGGDPTLATPRRFERLASSSAGTRSIR
jgi:hypothetical protein